MSIYLDFNTTYTSNNFNLKDSFLYSSGVLKHISFNFLTPYLTSSSSSLPALPASSTGLIILNGQVIVLDSGTQFLTGTLPPYNYQVTVGITLVSGTPYYSIYPAGLLPNNYTKLATFLPAQQLWVYEPVVGQTRDLIKNSFGYKMPHILSTSSTSIPLYGNEGYVYSDFDYNYITSSADLRCGISITGSFQILTSTSGALPYVTQLIIDPFLKTALHVPIETVRTSAYTFTSFASAAKDTPIYAVPGPLISLSGVTYESFLTAFPIATGSSLYSLGVCYFNGQTSNLVTSSITVGNLGGYAPILTFSLSSYGSKFIYLTNSSTVGFYNISTSVVSGTVNVNASYGNPVTSSFPITNYSATTLGRQTFVCLQSTSTGNLQISLLTNDSSELALWPVLTLSSTPVSSSAAILIDKASIAHIIYLSSGTLNSYNVPLGTSNSGSLVTLFSTTGTNQVTYFSAAQNFLGDSIIVVLFNNNLYKSINLGPWTLMGNGITVSGSPVINTYADASYFNVFVSSTSSGTTLFQVGLDGFEFMVPITQSGLPFAATLSPLLINPTGSVNVFGLPRMFIGYPSILQYRWNPMIYPSGSFELVYPNELNNESRIDNVIDVNGNLRPQIISSTQLWVLGDNSVWYRVHAVSGTLYTSLT